MIEQPQNSLLSLSSFFADIIEFSTDIPGKYKIELVGILIVPKGTGTPASGSRRHFIRYGTWF